MGLLERIKRARLERRVVAIMRQAETEARIAVALFEDKARDGGLLIHVAVENDRG